MQLATRLGATVTGVCSTRNIELIRSLGTDHAIDYTIEDVTEMTDRYDLVLQVAGTHRASQLRRLLTPKGTLVQLSGDSPNHWVGPLGRILAGRVLSVFVGQTVTSFTVQPNRDDLEVLASLVDRGVVGPISNAPTAWARRPSNQARRDWSDSRQGRHHDHTNDKRPGSQPGRPGRTSPQLTVLSDRLRQPSPFSRLASGLASLNPFHAQ